MIEIRILTKPRKLKRYRNGQPAEVVRYSCKTGCKPKTTPIATVKYDCGKPRIRLL